MLQTFVIGLGRAGAGLHVSVLSRLRERAAVRRLFAERPLVVCDPRFASPRELQEALRRWGVPGWEPHGIVPADSVAGAARLLDPEHTVVHLATPPAVRLEIIEALAREGFRKILVEKPLALDERMLAGIERARDRWGLHLVVVAHWLVSALTARLHELVRNTVLGELRSLSFLQCKPRFSRSLATGNHPTAFDVEPPHSVGVALRLAGAARLADAGCTDMVVGDTVLPRLGSARLTLQHDCGVRTEIASDLTAPVRLRRVVLQFDRGLAIGHYPGSQDDDHAQLSIVAHSAVPAASSAVPAASSAVPAAPGGDPATSAATPARSVFPDDALATFLVRAYRRFSVAEGDEADFALNAAGARLLCAAKRWRSDRAPVPSPGPAGHPLEPSLGDVS